jgi:agmatinase
MSASLYCMEHKVTGEMALNQPANLIPFMGMPQPAEEAARAALIPVPLEATVSYGGGTALGPAGLLRASAQVELYDELLDLEPYAYGILTRPRVAVHGEITEVLERIEKAAAAEIEAGRLPVLLGGEHTVTLGALKALLKKRGPDFTVLTLDAHLDLRDEYEDSPYSHACVMRRALDLGLTVRHMGSRSCSTEEIELVRKLGLKPIWARQVHQDPDWRQKALQDLSGPIYISLDVDGLDPSIMPGTGTPEPGGLDWNQVSDWLAAACRGREVVGLDIVELAPQPGQALSDFTAARLLYRALGLALKEKP